MIKPRMSAGTRRVYESELDNLAYERRQLREELEAIQTRYLRRLETFGRKVTAHNRRMERVAGRVAFYSTGEGA